MVMVGEVMLNVGPHSGALRFEVFLLSLVLHTGRHVIEQLESPKAKLTSKRIACPKCPWRAAFAALVCKRSSCRSALASCCRHVTHNTHLMMTKRSRARLSLPSTNAPCCDQTETRPELTRAN